MKAYFVKHVRFGVLMYATTDGEALASYFAGHREVGNLSDLKCFVQEVPSFGTKEWLDWLVMYGDLITTSFYPQIDIETFVETGEEIQIEKTFKK